MPADPAGAARPALKVGDLVQYWFDTGAMGATILYGKVIASGPKAAVIQWESSICNRVRHDAIPRSLKLAEDQADAARAMKRAQRHA